MAEEEAKKDERSEHGDYEDRCEDRHGKHKHHHHHRAGDSFGIVWCIGWLFTIGYVHLPFFWKGVLALVIWPYYLGNFLNSGVSCLCK
jgi:hypothetical protein